MSTYSISLRLRRVIYEDAYVAVPEPHPIQQAAPEERETFDAFYDQSE